MEKPAQHIIRNNLLALLTAAVVLSLAGRFVSNSAVLLFGLLFVGQVAVNFLLGVSYWFNQASKISAAPYFLRCFWCLLSALGLAPGWLLSRTSTFTDAGAGWHFGQM